MSGGAERSFLSNPEPADGSCPTSVSSQSPCGRGSGLDCVPQNTCCSPDPRRYVDLEADGGGYAEVAGATEPPPGLTADFRPPGPRDNKFLLCESPRFLQADSSVSSTSSLPVLLTLTPPKAHQTPTQTSRCAQLGNSRVEPGSAFHEAVEVMPGLRSRQGLTHFVALARHLRADRLLSAANLSQDPVPPGGSWPPFLNDLGGGLPFPHTLANRSHKKTPDPRPQILVQDHTARQCFWDLNSGHLPPGAVLFSPFLPRTLQKRSSSVALHTCFQQMATTRQMTNSSHLRTCPPSSEAPRNVIRGRCGWMSLSWPSAHLSFTHCSLHLPRFSSARLHQPHSPTPFPHLSPFRVVLAGSLCPPRSQALELGCDAAGFYKEEGTWRGHRRRWAQPGLRCQGYRSRRDPTSPAGLKLLNSPTQIHWGGVVTATQEAQASARRGKPVSAYTQSEIFSLPRSQGLPNHAHPCSLQGQSPRRPQAASHLLQRAASHLLQRAGRKEAAAAPHRKPPPCRELRTLCNPLEPGARKDGAAWLESSGLLCASPQKSLLPPAESKRREDWAEWWGQDGCGFASVMEGGSAPRAGAVMPTVLSPAPRASVTPGKAAERQQKGDTAAPLAQQRSTLSSLASSPQALDMPVVEPMTTALQSASRRTHPSVTWQRTSEKLGNGTDWFPCGEEAGREHRGHRGAGRERVKAVSARPSVRRPLNSPEGAGERPISSSPSRPLRLPAPAK
ncbi:hypothetical protein Cadr_000010684 [Camelus dromedarius]|uniref:Uncharacterized protein n=1 Tax=Camelus dromedarius TaxID=9838 RepID=A0A5N4DRJ9_CAMDR|nr:hypothetical protein Cadr_000010684 [Camelus dromedarius]